MAFKWGIEMQIGRIAEVEQKHNKLVITTFWNKDMETEIQAIKKPQTKGILEIELQMQDNQQISRDRRENLRCQRYNRGNRFIIGQQKC